MGLMIAHQTSKYTLHVRFTADLTRALTLTPHVYAHSTEYLLVVKLYPLG